MRKVWKAIEKKKEKCNRKLENKTSIIMARDVRLWGRERSAIEMTLFALLTQIYYPHPAKLPFSISVDKI